MSVHEPPSLLHSLMSVSLMPSWKLDPNQNPIEWPRVNTRTIIGISVAIAGNVLISFALNVQKLAHKRVELANLQRSRERELQVPTNSQAYARRAHPNRVDEGEEHDDRTEGRNRVEGSGFDVFGGLIVDSPTRTSVPLIETEPLLATRRPSPRVYVPEPGLGNGHIRAQHSTPAPKRKLLPRLFAARLWNPQPEAEDAPLLPVEAVTAATKAKKIDTKRQGSSQDDKNHNETEYLKSKLWWLGFFLMNVGELGNFISYAFAPASMVAPLGTFALIANCVFAPLMLGEQFRKRDLLGMLIAIIGAVTVVLSSNTSDVRLNPDALIRAISQHIFIVYSCVYAIGAVILAVLSEGEYGRRYVFVDVGLCALFGGFTVLSTKGVSTLLTMEWIEMFTEWITYPIILVLLSTGVGQIKYLNRALMRFDSRVVIPIQFVFFNLSAIIGSAILYGDFRKATFHQFVTFIYGCIATFAGVFVIASDADSNDDGEGDTESEPEATGDDLRFGSVGRRRRPALVSPTSGKPILNHRHSAISLSLSPAPHLLFVHTPPRDSLATQVDPEGGEPSSPETRRRRRAISWISEDPHALGRRTRESSLVGVRSDLAR